MQCRRHGFDSWVGKIPWRRKWQPTPVFLPGESHGQRSLVGYSPWGCKRAGHDLATQQQKNVLRLHHLAFLWNDLPPGLCRATFFSIGPHCPWIISWERSALTALTLSRVTFTSLPFSWALSALWNGVLHRWSSLPDLLLSAVSRPFPHLLRQSLPLVRGQ